MVESVLLEDVQDIQTAKISTNQLKVLYLYTEELYKMNKGYHVHKKGFPCDYGSVTGAIY